MRSLSALISTSRSQRGGDGKVTTSSRCALSCLSRKTTVRVNTCSSRQCCVPSASTLSLTVYHQTTLVFDTVVFAPGAATNFDRKGVRVILLHRERQCAVKCVCASSCSVGCGGAGRVRRSLAIRSFASKQFSHWSDGNTYWEARRSVLVNRE